MKNRLIVTQLFLFLSLCFCSAVCLAAAGESPMDSVSSLHKSGQANYIMVRYVIGSGGVIHATSPSYIHSATAGEALVGGMQGPNNLLLSGFWLPAGLGPTEVEQGRELSTVPTTFALQQNYPNPFNPQTTIQYDLPEACKVTVEIFNAVGQRIRLLSEAQSQGPGFVRVSWDGRNEEGKMLGTGIYLYRITAFAADAGSNSTKLLFQQTKKMLFVK